MTPDEVIDRLAAESIILSRQTLRRYEKQELIGKPKRGSGGRGVGRWTEYDKSVLPEVFAAWLLLNGNWTEYYKTRVFMKGACLSPVAISYMRKSFTDRNGGEGWQPFILDIDRKEFFSSLTYYEVIVDTYVSEGMIGLYGVLFEKAKVIFSK